MKELRERIVRALDKMGVPYQDVTASTNQEYSRLTFVAEQRNEYGEPIPFAVTVPDGFDEVWVQVGLEPVGLANLPLEWLEASLDNFDAGLQNAPASFFAQHKMPKFRERGFHAHVAWNPSNRQLLSAVTIPEGEVSSGVLSTAAVLAAYLASNARQSLAQALNSEARES